MKRKRNLNWRTQKIRQTEGEGAEKMMIIPIMVHGIYTLSTVEMLRFSPIHLYKIKFISAIYLQRYTSHTGLIYNVMILHFPTLLCAR